jgi:hypothetical protein
VLLSPDALVIVNVVPAGALSAALGILLVAVNAFVFWSFMVALELAFSLSGEAVVLVMLALSKVIVTFVADAATSTREVVVVPVIVTSASLFIVNTLLLYVQFVPDVLEVSVRSISVADEAAFAPSGKPAQSVSAIMVAISSAMRRFGFVVSAVFMSILLCLLF